VREIELGVFRENAILHENSLASRERVRVREIELGTGRRGRRPYKNLPSPSRERVRVRELELGTGRRGRRPLQLLSGHFANKGRCGTDPYNKFS